MITFMVWSCPLVKDTVVLGNCILPIFCWTVDWLKLLKIFSLDKVVEFVAWWEQAYSYFFVYTVGVQSNPVDLVIIRIHVETLMLVCSLLVVLLDHGKEIDVVVFSPCCWSQLLHKHCYPYFPCAIPCPCHHGKNYPTWCGKYSMLLPHSKNWPQLQRAPINIFWLIKLFKDNVKISDMSIKCTKY